jgi:hypothetical protein
MPKNKVHAKENYKTSKAVLSGLFFLGQQVHLQAIQQLVIVYTLNGNDDQRLCCLN